MSNESGTYVGVAIVCKNAPGDLWDMLYEKFGDDVIVYTVSGNQYVVSNIGFGKIHAAYSYEEKATEIESIRPAITEFANHHMDVFEYIRNKLNIDCYFSLVVLNWSEH